MRAFLGLPGRLTGLATVLVSCCLLCASNQALAFHVYKVDPYCPDASVFGTIQAAVDAAAAYDDADHADYVWISQNTEHGAYAGQHIVVDDPNSVIIEGGFFDCTDFDPGADQTTVSGAGNGGGPVFDIVGTGHTVYLGNLFVTGAQRGGGASGGGINFTGAGELDIAQSTVVNNHAGYGAGINVTASGGQAVLKLAHDTLVYLNTAAGSGGGIRLEGDARLFVIEPHVAINGNSAADYGGGILILGPAHADIGSAGGGFGDGVVAANYAANGGGIAVIDNGNGGAVLRVFADGAHQPTPIVENRASINGGAVYLSGHARARLYAPRVSANIAEDGAAIYYDLAGAATTGDVNLNGGDEYDPELVSSLGGTTNCVPADAQCSVIANNATEHADNTPSAGAVIRAIGGKFDGVYFRMQHNIAASGMHVQSAEAYIARCLITDNSFSANLFLGPVSSLAFAGCTIANNTIGDKRVFSLTGSSYVEFESIIVDQPGKSTVDSLPPGVLYANDVVTNDRTNLDYANSSIVAGAPVFVDAANGDYHLRGDSLGIDFAANHDVILPELYTDLDGLHMVDLAQVSDFIGPYDVGAYERQYFCAADTLFCNGFDAYGYQP